GRSLSTRTVSKRALIACSTASGQRRVRRTLGFATSVVRSDLLRLGLGARRAGVALEDASASGLGPHEQVGVARALIEPVELLQSGVTAEAAVEIAAPLDPVAQRIVGSELWALGDRGEPQN